MAPPGSETSANSSSKLGVLIFLVLEREAAVDTQKWGLFEAVTAHQGLNITVWHTAIRRVSLLVPFSRTHLALQVCRYSAMLLALSSTLLQTRPPSLALFECHAAVVWAARCHNMRVQLLYSRVQSPPLSSFTTALLSIITLSTTLLCGRTHSSSGDKHTNSEHTRQECLQCNTHRAVCAAHHYTRSSCTTNYTSPDTQTNPSHKAHAQSNTSHPASQQGVGQHIQ